MKSILLVAVAFAFIGANVHSTEIVEIQLPQLLGSYCVTSACTSHHDIHFQLPRVPLAIHDVRIHISGTVNPGQYDCDFGDGLPIVPHPYSMEFFASMPDTVGGYPWVVDGGSPEEAGQFDLTIPFRELYGWPVTWDFLNAGYGNFEFSGMPHGLLVDCQVLIWPEAVIEQAALIIEGDFEVGVESSTWGSIKSLFR
jgi:hypothetical protein